METKTQIRKKILAMRDALSEEERQEKSAAISQRLFALACYQEAVHILLYAAYRSEVATRGIFERAVSDGKQVYFPLCEGKNMTFYRVDAWETLHAGYQGILEPPAADAARFAAGEDGSCALMVMPGAAFDKNRNRMGYGGGFYDRYLANGFAGKTIALGFDFQLLQEGEIPAEDTDIRPDMILTERGLVD